MDTPPSLAHPAAIKLGARLRERRNHLGLTQLQLADASGVSQASISAIEKGASAPTLATFLALSSALGLDSKQRDELLDLASLGRKAS